MPINQLYDTWMRRICELRPGQRITQTRNFVWLMIGIYQSRSACATVDKPAENKSPASVWTQGWRLVYPSISPSLFAITSK
jgi:hypothetical protein